MATGGWSEEAGRRMMMYLAASPLEYHTPGLRGEVRARGAAGEAVEGFARTSMAGKDVGEKDLRSTISNIFPSPSPYSKPQIETFSGYLLNTASEYKARLKPGLHLVISYALTINELPSILGSLTTDPVTPRSANTAEWGDGVSGFYDKSSGTFFKDIVVPLSATPQHIKRRETPKRRYHLQPPRMTFHPSRKLRISVLLGNAAFPNAFYPHGPADDSRVRGISKFLEYPESESPALDSNFNARTAEDLRGEYTVVKPSTIFNKKPSTGLLPPWSPFGLYTTPSKPEDNGAYKIVSGGTFPTTTWDVFAQERRKRVICSVGWELFTSDDPDEDGIVVDAVSGARKRWLDWKLDDSQGEIAQGKIACKNRSSEKRVYANYDGSNGHELTEDAEDMGWWMVAPERIPSSFITPEDMLRTFEFKALESCTELLGNTLALLGLPGDEIDGFIECWRDRLAAGSTGGSSILMKFLHPKELEELLPVAVTPRPDRLIRVFVVFRVVTAEELEREGVVPLGVLEQEVEILTSGGGACGGGRDCGHGGCFRVFEVGGCQVLGGSFGDEEESVWVEALVVGEDGMEAWTEE
ncbi:hypothetical protein RUND412_002258 [Rhizina undulata]